MARTACIQCSAVDEWIAGNASVTFIGDAERWLLERNLPRAVAAFDEAEAQGADARWMNGRDDSPVYPSLRLFRQDRSGDWKSVVDAVDGALAGAVRSGAAG